jgi:hypothetical protein
LAAGDVIKMINIKIIVLIFISTVLIKSVYCGDYGLTVADSTDTCYHKNDFISDQISLSPNKLLIKIENYFAVDSVGRQLWFTCLRQGSGFTKYCKPVYRTMLYNKLIEILKRDKIKNGTAIYYLVYGQYSRELETKLHNALKENISANARRHLLKADKIIEDRYNHKWIVID